MPRFLKSPPLHAALITLLLISCSFGTAYATAARLRALAGGDYLEDDHNVRRWYGSLADYANLIVLESGDFTVADGWQSTQGRQLSGLSLGTLLQLDQSGQWGTAALFVDTYQNDKQPGSLVRDSMKATMSAMWSKRFGGWQPTLVLCHGQDSGSDSWSRSRTDYGFGVRVDVSDGAYFDFASELRTYREEEDGVATTSADNYGFRARLFVRLTDSVALVPLVDYLHEDRPHPAYQGLAPVSMNGHAAKIGMGLSWFKDPDHTLLLAVDHTNAEEFYHEPQLTDLNYSAGISQTWQSTAVQLAFETRYAYWFTLRMSAVFRQLQTDPLLGEKERSDAFNLNLGAALQIAAYDLDLAISDTRPRSFAQTPPSPQATAEDIWFTVSLRRRW